MKGLKLARQFYDACGREMIHEQFPEYEGRIAVGLVGEGSECFGYDDEISRDHDFEAGFCIWITKEVEQEIGFRLFRAYNKLPDTFQGVKLREKSALGTGRRGVMEIGEFYKKFTGRPGAPESLLEWLWTPEYALAASVNGEVFCDPEGTFSAVRKTISEGYPEDVRRKKIAARAVTMAQAGQYNYGRMRKRGEMGAAGLALGEFVQAAVSMIYLLNNRYAPYYKWVFRGARELPLLSEEAKILEKMLVSGENEEQTVERVCGKIISEMKKQGLTDGTWDYLEPHAFQVMERIKDSGLRSLHIMEG